MKTDIIFYGRTLGSIELRGGRAHFLLLSALEHDVIAAAFVVEGMLNASWPDEPLGELAPQPRLLACARILSAIVRGCDSSKQNVWHFTPRDVVLEDRIATLFLRSGGLRIIGKMNEQWQGRRVRKVP